MIENDDNMNRRIKFSQIMTIDDTGGDITVVFPDTNEFIAKMDQQRNAEKLHDILKRM